MLLAVGVVHVIGLDINHLTLLSLVHSENNHISGSRPFASCAPLLTLKDCDRNRPYLSQRTACLLLCIGTSKAIPVTGLGGL
jgi:hypothetical protein